MVKRNGGKAVNQQYLFHGTDPSLVEAICEQNFDWRMCGVHGTAYGKGGVGRRKPVWQLPTRTSQPLWALSHKQFPPMPKSHKQVGSWLVCKVAPHFGCATRKSEAKRQTSLSHLIVMACRFQLSCLTWSTEISQVHLPPKQWMLFYLFSSFHQRHHILSDLLKLTCCLEKQHVHSVRRMFANADVKSLNSVPRMRASVLPVPNFDHLMAV